MGAYISKSDIEDIENIILNTKKSKIKIYNIIAIVFTLLLLYLIFCNIN